MNWKINRLMRYFKSILFLLFLCSFFDSFGQKHFGCSDLTFTREEFDRMKNFDLEMQRASYSRSTSTNELVYFTVQVHVIHTSSKEQGADLETIRKNFKELNTLYKEVGIQFQQCNSVNYIDETEASELEFRGEKLSIDYTSNGGSFSRNHNVENAINVYFFPKVYNGSISRGGAGMFPWKTDDYVFIANGENEFSSEMLKHEMGHYFGLYHTHETAFGAELVDRDLVDDQGNKLCEQTGDKLCDTEADPRLSTPYTSNSPNVDSECLYTDKETKDSEGEVYIPIVNNIMGYALGCTDAFTEKQISKMYNSATQSFRRKNKLCKPCDNRRYDLDMGSDAITSSMDYIAQNNLYSANDFRVDANLKARTRIKWQPGFKVDGTNLTAYIEECIPLDLMGGSPLLRTFHEEEHAEHDHENEEEIISEDPTFTAINLYPNPTTGDFTLELPFETESTVLVMDMVGKVVINEQMIGQQQLSLYDQPTGIYMVRIQNGSNIETIKLIKE